MSATPQREPETIAADIKQKAAEINRLITEAARAGIEVTVFQPQVQISNAGREISVTCRWVKRLWAHP